MDVPIKIRSIVTEEGEILEYSAVMNYPGEETPNEPRCIFQGLRVGTAIDKDMPWIVVAI